MKLETVDNSFLRCEPIAFNNHKLSFFFNIVCRLYRKIYARPHVNQIESHFSTISVSFGNAIDLGSNTHHMCATIRKRTHQNTMCTRPSYDDKKSIQNNNTHWEENKYLLHSFKHVFLLLLAFFVFPLLILRSLSFNISQLYALSCRAIVFMLKNHISFDNATHWIPTRCEDVTRSERSQNESLETKTSSAYKQIRNIHIYFAQTKESNGLSLFLFPSN